jgi:uncharacterized iron-regulated protein
MQQMGLPMRRLLIALSLLSAVPLLAIAAARGTELRTPSIALPDLTSFQFMRKDARVAAPIAIGVDEAAGMLKDYDVIFLGEWHDHPGNHLAEMALFRALSSRVPLLALSMEQFERDVQPVIDDYMAGRIGEENLRRRGRAWSNYAESYRPLVEYAKEHGLSVIAAEAPTRVVRCVGEQGPEFLSRLSPEQRGWAAAELHLGEGAYRDKFYRFLAEDGDHGPAPDAADKDAANARSFAAQVTRDDTMAESILLYLQKHPGHKVVHITGAFHVEGSLGTVERLKLRAPNLGIAVVEPVEVRDSKPIGAGAEMPGGDIALFLRALPESYASEAEKKAAETGRTNATPRRQCDL